MTNIAAALTQVAAKWPDRTALTCKRGGVWQDFSFAEIEGNAASYADFLRQQGIRPGDRVMLMVPPSMEFICLTFALFALGATVILIDPGMGYKNLLSCIGAVRPSALVAIAKAQLFSRLFPQPFRSVRLRVCLGFGLGLCGRQLPPPNQALAKLTITPLPPEATAAIIFTTGSTGPPKGVRYPHRVFQAQLQQIHDYYRIGEDDIDQPAFPLFGLFAIALGAQAVIPEMDPSRPAKVDPAKFIDSINRFGVTYSFGSPAIWKVISHYCQKQEQRLPSLKKVLMAGAPVSGELIEALQAILPPDAEIHIPYGATESLPVVSISGREVVDTTWAQTKEGKGACVGRPLPGIDLRVMAVHQGPLSTFSAKQLLPVGTVGEIIVRGPVVTEAYDHNEAETLAAKIPDGEGFWHRLGDLGYLDELGRLWFCGRKAHRVTTASGPLDTICCEAIFNTHPLVNRTALVGVGPAGAMRPVLIIEPVDSKLASPEQLIGELRALAAAHPHTTGIQTFLIHPSFPVDIRHNAKIFREKLALWAARHLS